MTFKQRQCCHDLMLVSEHVIDNDSGWVDRSVYICGALGPCG